MFYFSWNNILILFQERDLTAERSELSLLSCPRPPRLIREFHILITGAQCTVGQPVEENTIDCLQETRYRQIADSSH